MAQDNKTEPRAVGGAGHVWGATQYTPHPSDNGLVFEKKQDKVLNVMTYCGHVKSKYTGLCEWQDVTAAYKAWKDGGRIEKIYWLDVKEQVRYCFFAVKAGQLQSQSRSLTEQVEKLFPKIWSMPETMDMFVSSDAHDIFSTTIAAKPPRIHLVLTEDRFLREFCPSYYHHMMYKREEQERRRERREYMEEEAKASAERAKRAEKKRVDAEEKRAREEQIIVKHGKLPSSETGGGGDETTKKPRRRG